MLIEALQSVLTTEPTVTALVGTTATRPDGTNGCYPVRAIEQPNAPYLVLEQAGGDPLAETMEGTGRLTSERWKIMCVGTTYARAKRLAKTVRRFLLSLHGAQAGNAFIQAAFCRMEADGAESLAKGTIFSTELTFEFLYTDGD